jgi:hypothetical protein
MRKNVLYAKVCDVFKESPFVTYTDSAPTHNGDRLTNAIHPLFHESTFGAEFRYDILIPSLRLATHLLTSDAATLFLITYIDGKLLDYQHQETTTAEYVRQYDRIRSDDNPTRNEDLLANKTCAFVIPPTQNVTYHHRRRAAAILDHISKFISFVGVEGRTGSAATIPSEHPHTGHLASLYPFGRPSHIELALSPCYTDMVDLSDAAALGKEYEYDRYSTGDLIALRFHIASTLLHELGHVVHALKFGQKSPEVFYGADSKCSEAGYSLESANFGGLIRGSVEMGFSAASWNVMQNRTRPTFYMKPWPCNNLFLVYLYNGNVIGWRSNNVDADDMIQRVPYSFIASLFEDEFWKRTFKQQSLESVFPPQVAQWAFVTPLHKKGHIEVGAHPLSWSRIVRMYRNAFQELGISGADEKDKVPEHVLDTANLDWLK